MCREPICGHVEARPPPNPSPALQAKAAYAAHPHAGSQQASPRQYLLASNSCAPRCQTDRCQTDGCQFCADFLHPPRRSRARTTPTLHQMIAAAALCCANQGDSHGEMRGLVDDDPGLPPRSSRQCRDSLSPLVLHLCSLALPLLPTWIFVPAVALLLYASACRVLPPLAAIPRTSAAPAPATAHADSTGRTGAALAAADIPGAAACKPHSDSPQTQRQVFWPEQAPSKGRHDAAQQHRPNLDAPARADSTARTAAALDAIRQPQPS